MKNLLSLITVFAFCSLLFACNSTNDKPTKAIESNAANEKLEAAEKNYKDYPQYVSCKIDGQPYLAYYAENHTTSITNALNISSQVVFATSADQVTINNKTKISEISISFYTLNKKGAGALTSNKDFYVQGHTDFPSGNDLKYASFKTDNGQQLMLESYKDGLLEGSFNIDVVDENDPSHIIKITEGHFKLKQEKPTNIKADENGDVNMDSLMNSLNVK